MDLRNSFSVQLAKIPLLVLGLVVLASCASRPVQEGKAFGPGLPDPSTALGTDEDVKQPHKRISIGLVVGGNGVASFAAVGVIKKLVQEGITPAYIVATGWPAVFAAAYGLSASPHVHDLEWFAMKLQEKDFGSGGFFEFRSGDRLSDTLESTLRNRDIGVSRVPFVLMAPATETSALEVYDRGDWRFPVARSLGFPGLGKQFPKTGVIPWSEARPIDVGEGLRRGADRILAFSMYSDYVDTLTKSKQPDARNFGKHFDRMIAIELQKTGLSARIRLGRAPMDFSAKRAAIQAGFKAANTLLRQMRRKPSSEPVGPQPEGTDTGEAVAPAVD